ncbi:MAG TPA: hypothetical protein VKA68_09185 [bacterium]|nr:hypothetical protein [bacterium]
MDSPPLGAVKFVYFNRYQPEKENRFFCQTFPADQCRVNTTDGNAFECKFGDNHLQEHRSNGCISRPAETVTWDVRWVPEPERNFVPFPSKALYRWKHPRSKLVTPNPLIHIDGTVTIGSLSLDIEGGAGSQHHLWSTQLPSHLAWFHCSAFEETDFAWIQGLTTRGKFFNLCHPRVSLLHFNMYDIGYPFNRIPDMARTSSDYTLHRWVLAAERQTHRTQIEIQNAPVNMVREEMALTADRQTYRHFTTLASAQVIFSERQAGTWNILHKLTCRNAATLLVFRSEPDPRVPLLRQPEGSSDEANNPAPGTRNPNM